MTNVSRSNPAGIWFDPLQHSRTLIPFTCFTSWEWTLSSPFLLMPFLIFFPPLSLSRLYLTQSILFCPCPCLSLSAMCSVNTVVCRFNAAALSDSARSLLRHRWLHTCLHNFTHIFRACGTGRPIAIKWPVLLQISVKQLIYWGGFSMRTMGDNREGEEIYLPQI